MKSPSFSIATVSPVLFALYCTGDMTLDQLMAFTVSDDRAAQEAAWFEVTDWQRRPHAIRQRLTAAHVPDSDRRANFITLDAYRAASGGVITDLFQTKSYLSDPALLDRLVAEKLEREAETVRAEGWQWVEIVPEIGFDLLRGFPELRGKREPLPAKEAKKLAKLLRQRDSMRDQDDLTDDEAHTPSVAPGLSCALVDDLTAQRRCGRCYPTARISRLRSPCRRWRFRRSMTAPATTCWPCMSSPLPCAPRTSTHAKLRSGTCRRAAFGPRNCPSNRKPCGVG